MEYNRLTTWDFVRVPGSWVLASVTGTNTVACYCTLKTCKSKQQQLFSLRASGKTESAGLYLWLVLNLWSWGIAINLNSISAQHRWPRSTHLPACVFLSDHRFQLTEALTSPLDLDLALPVGAMVTVCLPFPLPIWGLNTTSLNAVWVCSDQMSWHVLHINLWYPKLVLNVL